ncbi:polysaccharide deacetylase family protein [Aneurinibacillus terranovensis]|uniref:polysaccharide deacetylase family protein n=1 Tax=Aneurinibacillus terranovensis TaxID=278991 RepID=UPI00040FD3EF|nr:polysaccharide deacetylase family protein [Aneurinibacillus terranovensis]
MTKLIKHAILIGLLLHSFGMNQKVAEAAIKNRAYWEAKGDIIWEINTKDKVIALTFDDGPDPQYTQQILDLLDKYEAKGTFFVIGSKAESNASLIKEMKQKGHEIANHTYHHPNMRTIKQFTLLREINDTDNTIHAIIGTYPALFRPPGGTYNDKVVEAAKTGNHLVVMWSWTQDTKDWRSPGVQKIVDKVCKNAKPGNIVLFHDSGGDRSQTVKALEIILDKLSKEGYRFATVSQMISFQNKKVAASTGK